MIHDEEFDLTWSDDPPGWVYYFGPLLEFWGNPIFQRRYVMFRLKPAFGVAKSFWIGFILSTLLNALILKKADKEEALGLGLLLTVVLPVLIAFGFMGMRMFTLCLIGTPMELRRELYSGMLGSVLTTPMSDGKIFIAECISGLMRGLGAMEEILAMIAGLVVPFVIVMHSQLLEMVSGEEIVTVWWVVFGVMVIIIMLQVNVLTTFAAGLYSVLSPVGVTVVSTLVHVWGVLLLCLWIPFLAMGLLVRYDIVHNPDPLVVLLAAAAFMIIVLMFLTVMTARLGVDAFARARRPGYYEPERATSAGFLRREGRAEETRFGQRI